jgi:hypothetical protein
MKEKGGEDSPIPFALNEKMIRPVQKASLKNFMK